MGRYERFGIAFARSRVGTWLFVNVLTRVDRVLLRIANGRISTCLGTRFHHNLVLLTTTGARSGRPRTVPLLGFLDGEDILLIASKGGHPRHPAWYVNLRVNPQAIVRLGATTTTRVAREADGDERARLWRKAVDLYPAYQDYQARTARRIPVMILAPVAGPDRAASPP